MAIVTERLAQPALRSHSASLDVECSAEETFALVCAVEKWPVWLSFLHSARRAHGAAALGVGSEVLVRSTLPGNAEEVYEVESLIANYRLSLVGAYSVRRRLEFRVERRTARSKIHVLLTYPAYHGRLGAWVEGWRRGRKLANALEEALIHFKGLVEYRHDDAVLADL